MKMKDESKSAGGKARAQSLPPEKRREIARKAAVARWGEKPLQATHKGNFKEEFGFDVECYVLNDEQKTAVISQRGLAVALGLNASTGMALPRFVAGKNISPFVGAQLREKLEKPLIFHSPTMVPNLPPAIVYGHDVTILIDLCKAIINAESEGKLISRHAKIAKNAHVIVNASAKAGIKGLVYALSGYDATREETIAAFKFYVREEAREYEREFPEQLYEEWYRLYQIPRPEKNRPWKFKHLTVDHVYRPLAHSSGRILELTKTSRSNSDQRYKKLHQFLSDIGVKALRNHLGQLLGIARISDEKDDYERHFKKLFGAQPDLFD